MNTTTDFKQFGKWQSQSKEAPFRLTNFGFNRGSHDRYQFLKNDYDFDPPTSKINQRHMLMNTSPLATFQAGHVIDCARLNQARGGGKLRDTASWR